MDDNYIWYFNNGNVLKGKKAKDYILGRQKKLDRLMKKNEALLSQMKKFNTSDIVIGDETLCNDTSRLLETLENLSVMEILCEELLCNLKRGIDHDRGIR